MTTTTTRKFIGAAAIAALLAGTMSAAPFVSTAEAQSWRYGGPNYGYDRGYYGYDRGYRSHRHHPRHRYYSHRRNNGAAVAAGIIGLGAGVALGSALSQPRVYAAPPPTVYHAPPPAAYGPYYRSPGQGTFQTDPSAPVIDRY